MGFILRYPNLGKLPSIPSISPLTLQEIDSEGGVVLLGKVISRIASQHAPHILCLLECLDIGIIEKKSTTMVYWGSIGIMEKKMETTI